MGTLKKEFKRSRVENLTGTNPPMLRGLSLIGFEETVGEGSRFRAWNPATGEQLEPAYASASPRQLERAVALADEAARDFGRTSGKERAQFLRVIAENIEKIEDQLVHRAMRETALTKMRLLTETARTCHQLRTFAEVVEEGSWVRARIDQGEASPHAKPDLRSMLQPLGPVAVFGASNFPLAFSVAGGDTVSALAAGNPVIVKAHAWHPATSELVGCAVRDSVQACRLPEGVFSLLFDEDKEIGARLVQHSLIRAVGFTGSRKGGLALARLAQARPEPIPFYGELSSVNPLFVLPEALGERGSKIAEDFFNSFTLGAGQFCTKPGIVLLPSSNEGDDFLAVLKNQVEQAPLCALLSKDIRDAYAAGVTVRSERRGVRVFRQEEKTEPGFTAPTILFETDVATFLEEPGLAEELFGPSALVVRYESSHELLAVAKGMEGSLTATIHGGLRDSREFRELVDLLREKAGRVIFNGFPTGVGVLPAIIHGGPFPATSDGKSTSVGTLAIERFARPICFQDTPPEILPPELQDANPLGIWRLVDGQRSKDPVERIGPSKCQ